jgi:hypothetical protein
MSNRYGSLSILTNRDARDTESGRLLLNSSHFVVWTNLFKSKRICASLTQKLLHNFPPLYNTYNLP